MMSAQSLVVTGRLSRHPPSHREHYNRYGTGISDAISL